MLRRIGKHLLCLLLAVTASNFLVSCEKKANVLTVFIWPDYISPDVVSRFEAEKQCRVRLEYFTTNDELRQKLLYGKLRPDVIVPSSYELGFYASLGIIKKLNPRALPNVEKHISSKLFDFEAYKPLKEFGVPYFASPTGLAAQIKIQNYLPIKAPSWRLFQGPKGAPLSRDSNTLLSDRREVFAIALIANGYEPNSNNEAELQKAEATIKDWIRNATFDGESYIPKLLGGRTTLAQAYMGDVLPHEDLQFSLPKEGFLVTYDCMAIPTSSSNEKLALEFINFLALPEVCALNIEWTNYLALNPDAIAEVKKRNLLPSHVRPWLLNASNWLDTGQVLVPLGPDESKQEEMWGKISEWKPSEDSNAHVK